MKEKKGRQHSVGKLIFIMISVLAMISGITYMAVSNYRSSLKSFEKSGYIIDSKSTSSGNNKSNVYYFGENTDYKTRYDSDVTFSDINGEKVGVSQASFVHYNDNSISVLKKSVIFNLDEIGNEIPKYYNIFDNAILEYSNGTYYVDNLGKKLKFKRFIVKVDDNKYLLLGDKMKLALDDSKDITVNSNFVELNFVDEKVVTIENKDSKYQTIGKDASIKLGKDLSLNLDNRFIYDGKEAKVSIDQIIIDSSDNIEIQPIDESDDEDAEEMAEEDPNNPNGNGGIGSNASGDEEDDEDGGDSVLGGDVVESEVNESELVLPSADISDLDITANKIEGTIKINDKDSLIVGGITTTIIENSTGRTIDLIESPEGTYNIELASSRLSPDTVYNLVSTVSYKKNDIIYTMDIVQKVFSTSSLGVALEKDYFTSDSLNYILKFDEFTKVKSCNVNLVNTSGDILETIPIERGSETEKIVNFTALQSNKKYSIIVDNILYEDYIMSDDYSIEVSAKTLKNRPTIGNPSFVLDKKNGKFTLKLDNMVDSENGVENYKFQIFDTRTMDAGNGSPINVVEKASLSSVDINVDNILFYRGVPYIFNVVIEFYDNEKYVEYTTPYSQNMQLDGKEAPSISWKTNEVTFEKIDGTISILDSGNTIDMDKTMTIVYTNSIGTTEQFTTAGNSIIPFMRNNLRANETYTISVYGTVDLQDGNPAIDNYHIGSASVKTNQTNPFNTSFDVDNVDVSTTFKVTARLLNVGAADNRLEASTLTGITFVLHEGTTVDGRIVKTLPSRDRDLREYYSDLQEMYYNQSFVINPSFFGLNNSDLKAEYYTIEIKDAYDYTDFKNPIGINNNVVTVKSNGYVPDLPQNPEDALTFEIVRNKDAETIDSNLNATTPVGFNVKANYDNARRYARLIKYRVYDATNCPIDPLTGKKQCKEITSAAVDYEVPQDGSINYIYFPVDYGTKYNVEDTTLRRGHKYYVTYEAWLDLNGDGIGETKYPSKNNVTLRSKDIDLPKQNATIKMYPRASTSTSLNIGYTYSDIDKTMYQNRLFAAIGTQDILENTVSNINILETSTERTGTLSNLLPGMLNIYSKQIIYKQGDFIGLEDVYDGENIVEDSLSSDNYQLHTYIKQQFSSEYVLPNLTYYIRTDVNRLIITFQDYENLAAVYSKIAAVNLYFTGIENGREVTIEKKNIKINDGLAIVNLFELSSFVGQDIQLKVDALYDTELIGYKLDGNSFALQNIITTSGGGEYYSFSPAGNVSYESYTPIDSIFTKTFDNSKYTFASQVSNNSIVINHKPDEGGITFNYNHLVPKKLGTKRLQPATALSNSFTFSEVVPGISTLDENDVSRIIPLMTTVKINATLFGFDSGIIDVKDNKAYINIFKYDQESEEEMQEVSRTEINIYDLEAGVTIENLLPDTSYAMTITAEIGDNSGSYEEKHLFDVDDSNPSKTYFFTTLSGVNFDNFRYEYSAISYENKSLSFHYSMDRIMGFDEVKYVFSKRVVDPLTGVVSYEVMDDLVIPNESGLQTNMILNVDVPPGRTSFEFGKYYRLEVIPIAYVTIDGVRTPIELSNNGGVYTFNLRSLKNPYIGVKGVYTSENASDQNTITFIANVYDSNKVVVGGTYKVQVLDEDDNDITPSEFVDKNFRTSYYNRPFEVRNLNVGHVYKFKVKYTVDLKNDIVSAVDKEYIYEINLLGSDDINVGNITAVANSIYPNRIDLQFAYSHRLTAIDTLNYSIYNSEDGSSIDGSINFNPKEKTVGGQTIYVQSLTDTLPKFGVYYVQTQFLFNGRVVYDGAVDYTYLQ